MRNILSIVLFLSVCCLAEEEGSHGSVFCWAEYPTPGNTDELVIKCVNVTTNGIEYMDKDNCESLKNSVSNMLDTTSGYLTDLINSLDYIVEYQIPDIYTVLDNEDNYLDTWSVDLGNGHYTNLKQFVAECRSKVQSVGVTVGNLKNQASSHMDGIDGLRSQLDTIECSNASEQPCTGTGGNTECPCTKELNDILHVNTEILTHSRKMSDTLEGISVGVGFITNSLVQYLELASNIVSRLQAPDDRMWDEINDIYEQYSFSTNLFASTLDFTNLFYTIKQLIRDGEPGLQLTTEGVISLYNMAANLNNMNSLKILGDRMVSATIYFSNTVSKLFQEFNETLKWGSRPADFPKQERYPFLYSVFTNTTMDARTKFINLQFHNYGGATNWFQRMELYQQAALGWFDVFGRSEMEQNQDQQTESSLNESIYQTTNSLGYISEQASHLTNSVASVLTSVADSIALVHVTASLPTQISLFPEVDLGPFGVLPETYFTTEDISDYCDVARNATTLVWRASFWVMYVLAAAGVARLVLLLTLFIIHFVQRL